MQDYGNENEQEDNKPRGTSTHSHILQKNHTTERDAKNELSI